jgi:hypothetical protein
METGNGLGITSSGLGSGLFDFGYTTAQLPPSEAAATASQLESGGSGFNWGDAFNGVKDLAGLWLQVESNKNNWAADPTPQYRAQNGQVYPVGQAMAPPMQAGMNTTTLLLIAGVVVAVVLLAKE